VGNGAVWRIDDGSAHNYLGFYVITKVTHDSITVTTYSWED